eukprot:Rhum_TRINITY_DN13853_c0_g1::Rhum_TRINITY_DN13853_c0_g1_i1::g.65056::m.65056
MPAGRKPAQKPAEKPAAKASSSRTSPSPSSAAAREKAASLARLSAETGFTADEIAQALAAASAPPAAPSDGLSGSRAEGSRRQRELRWLRKTRHVLVANIVDLHEGLKESAKAHAAAEGENARHAAGVRVARGCLEAAAAHDTCKRDVLAHVLGIPGQTRARRDAAVHPAATGAGEEEEAEAAAAVPPATEATASPAATADVRRLHAAFGADCTEAAAVASLSDDWSTLEMRHLYSAIFTVGQRQAERRRLEAEAAMGEEELRAVCVEEAWGACGSVVTWADLYGHDGIDAFGLAEWAEVSDLLHELTRTVVLLASEPLLRDDATCPRRGGAACAAAWYNLVSSAFDRSYLRQAPVAQKPPTAATFVASNFAYTGVSKKEAAEAAGQNAEEAHRSLPCTAAWRHLAWCLVRCPALPPACEAHLLDDVAAGAGGRDPAAPARFEAFCRGVDAVLRRERPWPAEMYLRLLALYEAMNLHGEYLVVPLPEEWADDEGGAFAALHARFRLGADELRTLRSVTASLGGAPRHGGGGVDAVQARFEAAHPRRRPLTSKVFKEVLDTVLDGKGRFIDAFLEKGRSGSSPARDASPKLVQRCQKTFGVLKEHLDEEVLRYFFPKKLYPGTPNRERAEASRAALVRHYSGLAFRTALYTVTDLYNALPASRDRPAGSLTPYAFAALINAAAVPPVKEPPRVILAHLDAALPEAAGAAGAAAAAAVAAGGVALPPHHPLLRTLSVRGLLDVAAKARAHRMFHGAARADDFRLTAEEQEDEGGAAPVQAQTGVQGGGGDDKAAATKASSAGLLTRTPAAAVKILSRAANAGAARAANEEDAPAVAATEGRLGLDAQEGAAPLLSLLRYLSGGVSPSDPGFVAAYNEAAVRDAAAAAPRLSEEREAAAHGLLRTAVSTAFKEALAAPVAQATELTEAQARTAGRAKPRGKAKAKAKAEAAKDSPKKKDGVIRRKRKTAAEDEATTPAATRARLSGPSG